MKSLLFMLRRESLFIYYYVSFNGIEQYGEARDDLKIKMRTCELRRCEGSHVSKNLNLTHHNFGSCTLI